MTTKVEIEPGYCRRVAKFVLRRVMAVDVVGDRLLSEGLYDVAWREIHPVYMGEATLGEAEFRLYRIGLLTSAARSLSSAADGDTVELPISAAEAVDALRDFTTAIDANDELLWSLTEEEREEVVGCRYAATRMLEDIVAQHPGLALEQHDADLDDALAIPELDGPMRVTRTPADRRRALDAELASSLVH
jgi:hypothetical protein